MFRKCLVTFVALAAALATPTRCLALPPYPLSGVVDRTQQSLAQGKVQCTGLTRDDYLKITRGIVGYFQHFQQADGRIIDPFLHKEFQYSTPCYAWAASALIAAGVETNLLDSASRALSASLKQLAEHNPADNHGDFFTFPCMLAYEALRNRVSLEERKQWDAWLQTMDPEQTYLDRIRKEGDVVHNWNVVALCGEYLRHQNGFTGTNYFERYLGLQQRHFTSEGLYLDPHEPMAYDHFPRHFLAALLERGYQGAHVATYSELLERGAWTSLLMQSPRGELPTGGRSAQHQWNEAEQCVTYEIWAKRKNHSGDQAAASAFKRAAHLSLGSIQRWVRPSGELWIVKNRFDPAIRHGFEGYSSHSQYNLLAASMLSTAWLLADDSIKEGQTPADVGGFVIQLPELHKVFANAGGHYIEIDTSADPAYNSTGIVRVHRTGVEQLVGPSDVSPTAAVPFAITTMWKEKDKWHSLSEFGRGQLKAKLSIVYTAPGCVKFEIRYPVNTTNVTAVVEQYRLTPTDLKVTTRVEGKSKGLKVLFPAFAFDGQSASQINVEGPKASVRFGGSEQVFKVESPRRVKLQRTGQWLRCRNGYLEGIEGEVSGKEVVYTLKPTALPAGR